MKPKKVCRPKAIDGCNIDFYWPQYSEPSDPPEITIIVGENLYDEFSAKALRRDAKWMLRVAEWLEAKGRRK